jgi:predicted nucleotidyltransferase
MLGSVLSLDAILPLLRAELPGILGDKPVMLAYLHGSVAERTPLPGSDVDIALVFEPGCLLSGYDRMKIEFNIALEIERRCPIAEADVRSMDRAPLAFQGNVLTYGLLLYSRDDEFRVDYEVYTRKRYFDFLPVIEQMREALFDKYRRKAEHHGAAR